MASLTIPLNRKRGKTAIDLDIFTTKGAPRKRKRREVGMALEDLAPWVKDQCIIDEKTGCWIWQNGKMGKGYGSVRFQDRKFAAHRLTYAHAKGLIPDGMCVCHSCDTPACCNPDHLWLGTNADNVADREAKRRGDPTRMHGEKHGRRKLTWAQVRDIRRRALMADFSYRHLAAELGVVQKTIRRIVLKTHWREDIPSHTTTV